MEHSKLIKRIIILSVIMFVFFAGIYLAYSDIRSKNKKVSISENDLSLKNSQYQQLVSMQKNIENLKPEINKIDNSIVPLGGDVGFIENIETIAKSHDLEVEIESLNLSTDTKVSSSTVTTLKIKAKVKGAWGGIYTFLSEIESMPIKIKINKFSLINNDDLKLGVSNSADSNKKWESSFEISVLEYK